MQGMVKPPMEKQLPWHTTFTQACTAQATCTPPLATCGAASSLP